MSFSDLPKYPGESDAERAKALEQLWSDPAEPDSLRDRLRHLFPALVLIVGMGFALFVALGTAILLATRAVEAGLVSGLTLLAAFVALPAVAVGAAIYQRHRNRQRRGWE